MAPHPPPRPDGTLSWAVAAANAALLLWLAQFGVALVGGVLPPVTITLLVGAATVGALVVCGVAVGVGLGWYRREVSRATQIGAILGPMAWVAMAPVWTAGGPLTGGAMGAIAAAWGIAGVWVSEGLTQRGRPPSPPWFWGGAALVLAGLARLAAPGWGIAVGVAIASGLLVLSVCFVVAPSSVRSDRSLLAWLCGIAGACAFLPWLLPWALWDSEVVFLEQSPPSFVFVMLGPEAGPQAEAPIPTLELLRSGALRYRVMRTEPLAHAVLGLPNGDLIAPRLDARGYATAAILPQPGSLTVGARDVDQRPAGRGQLESSAGWMAGAPWLRGPASVLLRVTGQDLLTRSPSQLADAAGSWLLNWRALRAPAPFFLVLDLRTASPSPDAVDEALLGLLDHLHHLGLEGVAMLVFAVEGAEGSPEGELVVVPPRFWPRVAAPEAESVIWGRELGSALLAIADAPFGRPAVLPGPIELPTVRR